MRVTPEESDQAATWYHEDHRDGLDILLVAVWTEKKKGRGEDAPPTALHQRRSGQGILAVYDGVGGAGARSVGRTPDGAEISGAFLASRVAHFALEDWFSRTEVNLRVNTRSLDDAVGAAMRQIAVPPNMKISGTMVRHLPTTLAAIEYQVTGDHLNAMARWAGDSRAYLLSQKHGLQVITRDDTETSDALTLLINDQPMHNMVSADRPVQIHRHEYFNLPLPMVLVCATDGFFNYVPTPALFEHLLLAAMKNATDLRSWTARLTKRVQEYSGDDASLVAIAFGYPTYAAMQQAFRPRLSWLDENFAKPIRDIDWKQERERFVELRKSCWEDYRSGYERLIPATGASQ